MTMGDVQVLLRQRADKLLKNMLAVSDKRVVNMEKRKDEHRKRM